MRKLLDRFFHRQRQVSPPLNNATHRFLHGSRHSRYCNFTIVLGIALSQLQTAALLDYLGNISTRKVLPQFPNGIVSSFRLVRVYHEHREEHGRLCLAGLGADAVE